MLLAAAVRIFFFAAAVSRSDGAFERIFPRYDGYYEIAENLLHGTGFSRSITEPAIPDSVRTPLYPLFIAGILALFKSYYVVFFVQILIGSLIPFLAYRIALQLRLSEKIAFLSALLLAIEPLTVFLATTLQAETLFTALFLFGISFFLHYIEEQRYTHFSGQQSSLVLRHWHGLPFSFCPHS